MSLFELFGEPVWQRLTWTLLHFVWQGMIIAIAAALLLQISPSRRAHARYLICLAAFVLMAACPVVTFMVVQSEELAVADTQEMGIAVPTDTDVEGEPVEVEMTMLSGHLETPENYPPVESPLPPAAATKSSSRAATAHGSAPEPPEPEAKMDRLARAIKALQPYVLATWIVGVMAMAFRLSLSWLHIRWLAWGCQLIPAELTGRATLLAKRIGIRRTPRIRISEKLSEAVVVGLWRPLILLPVSWLTEMSPDVLEAVIAHELAHVRRFDLWVNLLQRLIETLLFYHPAVWWLSRCLSVEREMCADELAVIATNERIVYAEALEQVGRLRLARTSPRLSVGMRDKKMVLLGRVGNVLGLTSSDRPRSWPVALLALAVPLAVWLASTSVHSSAANQTLVAELNTAELDRWVEKANSRVQSEFDAAVDALVALGPQVAPEMIPLLKTGRTDRLGLKVLERLAPEPSVQQILIDAIEEAQRNRNPNVIHCGLIALGKSGNVAHADFIAAFLEKRDIAAMSALATLGGERARDHLLGAFDLVPTERWFILAGTLERLGDPAAVPELRKRLTQVELPPNDRFPGATVFAMTGAISALSGEKEAFTTHEYCQGQHFRYPFDGPGSPKTFSVRPLTDHYVRLPKVDPESKAGRETIWNTMAEATEGPGFTIDGNELVTFHGLKTAPLWPDGRPYPITLYDWLGRTSHQVLLDLIEQQEQTGRCTIPESGLLVALDPAGRLYVLSLKKTSDQSTYNVTVMPQDPNMQLIPVRADAEAMQLTETTSCTLHDLASETKDGSFNLSRGHSETMTREKWQAKSTDAVLVAEFASHSTALAIPGAEQFVLAEADDAWEEPEKLLSLLQAAAKQEPTIAGHKTLKQDNAIFHVFSQLSEGQKYAFAVRMPDGIPAAGVLEVRKVDRKNETIRLHHRSLLTAAAQQVFVTDGRPGAPMAQDGLPPSDANPLSLDDDTLITVFRAGNVLRDVAFDCESFYRDRGHLPNDIPELASRYQERSRNSIGIDPFAPGKKLRLVLDKDDERKVEIWSVGPDGDWDDGKQIDSTKQPLDGDLGAEIRVGNTDWHWLADETMRVCLQGERLAHYLAAKGPNLPKPELKDDGLKWGPVVDGLQLAVELSPQKNAYLLGETIDVKFHVRNAVDYAIQVGLAIPWRQDLTDQTVLIHDENGKSLTGKGVWMSGTVGTKQYTLKPGETATYESCDLAFVDPGKEPGGGSVGYWVEAAPGVYTAQFKQHFPIGFHSEPRQWRGELDTASITIRIAEHPKFAIHRVTAYRKPGDQPGMRSTLTFRESGNPARFDPMRPDLYPLEDLVIDGTPLLTEADIIAYNWKDHSIKLKPGVGGRLYNAVKLGNMYVPFVIQVEGEPIYLGAFRPPYSSNLANLPHISLMELSPSLPEKLDLERYSITIEGSQTPEDQPIRDPRSDARLRKALQQAGRLGDVRSVEPAWGESVEGLQCRLRLEPTTCDTNETVYANLEFRNTGKRRMNFAPAPKYFLFDVDGTTFGHPIHLGIVLAKSLGPGETVQYKVPINTIKSKETGERVHDFKPGRHSVKVQLTIYPKDGEPGGPVKITSNTAQLDIRAAEATVTGTVIGVDGKPAVGYRVTALPRAWMSRWGWMPTTTTDRNGMFRFENLPEGPCDVAVTSTPLTNQPNIRIESVNLSEDEPVHLELSLEQKYQFSGRVSDAAGDALTDRNVLAIWKDPTGKNTYSSNTKTDAEGRYGFASPFEVAERILVNDIGNGPELEDIEAGRDDIDLMIENTKDNSVTGKDEVEVLWSKPVDGLRWKISPLSDRIEAGKQIAVNMEFQNVSSHPLRIFKKPTVSHSLYPVIYTSDGERDMFSIEHNPDCHVSLDETVLIEPGQTYRATWSEMSTKKVGPAKILVSYWSPKNTNPGVSRFWSGQHGQQECKFTVVPVIEGQRDAPPASGEPSTTPAARIELKLSGDETKTVSVTLGQSAADIYGLCRPAKVYADDDPWLAVSAAGGGSYVFFFAAEGTPEEMRGRLDPRRDKLYAVLRYPTESKDNGTFLLPGTTQDRTYGDFVTMKVPLDLDQAKAATVALGMSTEEVKQLFPSAPDRADENHAVVFDSVYDDNQYLLIFTPEGDGTGHDLNRDKLSEVIYRHGDKPEAIYLLPRNKRGKPVAAEYRKLLGINDSNSGAGNSGSDDPAIEPVSEETGGQRGCQKLASPVYRE